jgi:hypothetical protein
MNIYSLDKIIIDHVSVLLIQIDTVYYSVSSAVDWIVMLVYL